MKTRELTSKIMQIDGQANHHQAVLIFPEIQRL
jgi:hypothetical protein